MSQVLTEKFKTRVAAADRYYGKVNEGLKLSNAKKEAVAQCFENVSKFLNEAWTANGVQGVQYAAMSDMKRLTA